MKTTDKYTFFWKTADVFSQWHPSRFVMDIVSLTVFLSQTSVQFKNAEQYMMFKKSELFNDSETAKKILASDNPRDMKALGRKVKNFNATEWDNVKFKLVKEGNFLKFDQNPDMKRILMSTGNTTLVEASPYDKVWGIGLDENDPRALEESKWLGENLLGKALTELRNEFNK